MEHQAKVAGVVSITPIGTGERVCIDMIDRLGPREGIFVGNTGHGYVKVLSENRQTDTYPARVFRINAGAIHQYILLFGDKTTYLSEVKPGVELPIFHQTDIRNVAVGRVKMEKREFVRVVCQVDGVTISATLQQSDSVHLETEDGLEKSIVDLQVGDKIICRLDNPGRHLGEKINEDIEEI
ncbi:3-dehydroquinate synthase II [Aquibacillus salsiterrae]|uniref:3-dehydroquinate synthase n=1 Tax=Aquibacillus salsiterrae TaxID=2950439 RepID=A0A9X4AFY4_9BACI|nr:3-dehydroquinate synthase II [Aquibacillus salsiterrae]MDC3418119.1 3-dehydroquinate synthase [Aquibacillus salsiterrae]